MSQKLVENFSRVTGVLMPTWISKLIVTTAIGLAFTAAGAWIGGVNHGLVIANQESVVQNERILENMKNTVDAHKRIDNLQPSLDKIEDKLDVLTIKVTRLEEHNGR